MATEIEIINSALAKIRGRLINTINDNSTEARLSKTLYPVIRDRLLREIAPNFAKETITLASALLPVPYNYAYAFPIPARVIKILETDRYESEDWKQSDGNIYANDSAFIIEAVVRITDAEKFDTVFAEALAYSLAAELALPLTNGSSLAQGMKQEAEMLVRKCRSYSAQERGSVQVVEATSWLYSRF